MTGRSTSLGLIVSTLIKKIQSYFFKAEVVEVLIFKFLKLVFAIFIKFLFFTK